MRISPRPIVRKAYQFDKEKVHLAVETASGCPFPRYFCDRCERDLPEGNFGPVAGPREIGVRAARFKYVAVLHPHCWQCRKQTRGQHVADTLYSPALDRYFESLVSRTKSNAYSRGILFALDKDDALGLFLAQRGLCALTGLEMDWKTVGHSSRNGRNYKSPSLDRIDSAGNYVLGNVHVVMQVANIMKNDLPIDMFVALCRQIADHNFTLA